MPEELVATAAELDMPAMALLDRDGVYGAPRFHMAAKKAGVRAHIGAEITCADGHRYPLLAETRQGYQNLCRLITRMKLRAKKGEGAATLRRARRIRRGPDLPHAGSDRAPGRHLRPRATSTPNSSAISIARKRRATRPSSSRRAACASRCWPPTASPRHAARSASCSTSSPASATRSRSTTPAACSRAMPSAISNPPREMARLFADLPEAIANTAELSARLQFTLADLGYEFPRYPVPEGETMASFLRQRTDEGARQRYRPYHERARRQIERELALIEKLELAGYFLIVWDIVRVLPRATASWCRAAARPPTAPSAIRSASPPSIRSAWSCCSSASSPKSAASGPTSISTCPAATSASASSSTSTSATASSARP